MKRESAADKLKKNLDQDTLLLDSPELDEITDEIRSECMSSPEWTAFSNLTMESLTEGQLQLAWLQLLNRVSGACDISPKLIFHDTSAAYMQGHDDEYDAPSDKPDVVVSNSSEKPTWYTISFLGEIKVKEQELQNTNSIGQLATYLNYYRLLDPTNPEAHGFVLAGKKAQVYKFSPAGCHRSDIIDCSTIEPVITLVLYIYEAHQNIDDHVPPLQTGIYINSNSSQPDATTNELIAWNGRLNPLFISRSCFGRWTNVWQDPETTFTLKRSYLDIDLAWHESIIMRRLLDAGVCGIPILKTAGLAGPHLVSNPTRFTGTTPKHCSLYSDTICSDTTTKYCSRTVYESILITDAIPRLDSLYKLSIKEIVLCLRDAMKIIWQAWKRAGVLHRDISVSSTIRLFQVPNLLLTLSHLLQEGNVRGIPLTNISPDQHPLLYNDDIDDTDGILLGRVIDWGNASDPELPNPNPDGRFGTAMFMSQRMHRYFSTEDPKAFHTPLDDLESLIYVLLFTLELQGDRKDRSVKLKCKRYLADCYSKRRIDERTVSYLATAWDSEISKDPLQELCCVAISSLPPSEEIDELISSMREDKDKEMLRHKITCYSEDFFRKFVELFTFFAQHRIP